MPGLYGRGEYDLAGFAVGAVERDAVLPRPDRIVDGDVVLGLASSGVHANGFSLVRLVLREQGLGMTDPCPWDSETRLGDVLLAPTRIYVAACLAAIAAGGVKALAHITGGGLVENPPRVLGDGQVMRIDAGSWRLPPVFEWLARAGRLNAMELLRTFNCGIGMIVVVDPTHADAVRSALAGCGETVLTLGTVAAASGRARVEFSGLEAAMARRRVAVLISGGGSNLQALIDATAQAESAAELVLVLCNNPGAYGMERARRADIPVALVDHRQFAGRPAFEAAVSAALERAGVELVCLAGFMRILTARLRRALARPAGQHPSVAATQLPWPAHPRPRPCRRGSGAWLHRASGPCRGR